MGLAPNPSYSRPQEQQPGEIRWRSGEGVANLVHNDSPMPGACSYNSILITKKQIRGHCYSTRRPHHRVYPS
jgi:hypothetical protein